MMPVRPLHGQWRRPDLRNHRKILVVDDQIAFCGSQNLVEASYGNEKYQKMGRKWVDLMARVTGTTVAALDAVFASDWYTESGEMIDVKRAEPAGPVAADAITDVTCQVVPSGPGFPSENNLRLFTSLLASATRRISITSPYFIPDESLLYAITTAAQRGVDVELFVNEQSDQFMVGHAQASYYDALLAAGVKILMYPPPLILHGKHFSIDDTVAVIGTSNMDLRSFALNYEVVHDAARPRGGRPAPGGRGRLPVAVPAADPGGVGAAAPAHPLRRHGHAPDGCSAVAQARSGLFTRAG